MPSSAASRFRAWACAAPAWGALAALLVGCGDPLLPGDFSGPPAGAVSGSVVDPEGDARSADRPRLALEWLVGFESGAPTLVQQGVEFHRSQRLQHDFDIDLRKPTAAAPFADGALGDSRVAVAKIVYFDDRVPDDRLDRGCLGERCDQIKAVSAHFVVYLEQPIDCERFTPGPEARFTRVHMTAGYHYFTFEGGVVREIGPEEALRLHAVPAAGTDFTQDLASFTAAFLRAVGHLPGGCR